MTNPNPTTEAGTKRKRRWISGLGLLMLVVAALAVPVAMVTNKVREQRRMIKMVEAEHGSVSFDYEFVNGKYLMPNRQPAAPKWLRKLVGDEPFRSIQMVRVGFPPRQRALRPISDRFLLELGNVPSLRTLELYYASIDDAQCRLLARLSRLTHLTVLYSNVGDEGVAALTSLRNLESIDLQQAKITNRALESLASIKSLTYVDVSFNSIDDSGVQRLSQLPVLKELQLHGANVHGEGLRGLANLEYLGMGDAPIDDSSMACIGKLHKLKWLQISDAKFTSEGLKKLEVLVDLEHLHARGTSICDEDLEVISRFTKLRSLEIRGTRVTDKGLATIEKMKSLISVIIDKKKISPASIQKLKKARPGLFVYAI
jgi:hypothetical protein